jgi:cell wall-associated NlpC family hydrolase
MEECLLCLCRATPSKMPLSLTQREHLVAVAEGWYGTPYIACACLKGVGVDCGQLLKGVYIEAGHKFDDGIPTPAHYSTDIAVHQDTTEYVGIVSKYMREIPESEVQPGDVVIYATARKGVFSHAGIIVKWPEHIVQATKREGVTAGHGGKSQFAKNHMLSQLERKFFTLREEFIGDK